MKIKDLYLLQVLDERCRMLLNYNINNDFYSYYFKNNIEWLLKNAKTINKDFNENKDYFTFDIIMNSTLNERYDLILSIDNIEEFSKYISIVPLNMMKKRAKNRIQNQFNKFMSFDDDFLKVKYFDEIRRK